MTRKYFWRVLSGQPPSNAVVLTTTYTILLRTCVLHRCYYLVLYPSPTNKNMKVIHNALLAAIASSVASSSLALAADHHSSPVSRKLSAKSGDGKDNCSGRPLVERLAIGHALNQVATSVIGLVSETGSVPIDNNDAGFAMLCAGSVRQNAPNAAEQKSAFILALTEADAAENNNGRIEAFELAQVIWNELGDCATVEQIRDVGWYRVGLFWDQF